MAVPKRIIVPLALLVAIGGAAIWHFLHRDANPSGAIRLSGNIEVTDAEVSFKIPGRVEQRLVDEGQEVKQGDEVAVLDKADLEAEVEMRQAELRLAEAVLREMQGSRPQEIDAAEAAWRRAEAALADLKAGYRHEEVEAAEAERQKTKARLDQQRLNFERAAELLKKQAISREAYDRAEAERKIAEQQLRAATENLRSMGRGYREQKIVEAGYARDQARSQYELVKLGPRQEKRDQAVARRDQAAASLGLAKIRLDYATLTSPLAGVVLSKNIEPGEYVSPGTPVVTVGDLQHVWLRAYINETDLGRVTLGQKVRVTTDTYPDKEYAGRVSFISSEAEFTPKSVQTRKERVKLVYRIKIVLLENPNMELLPGMPADAEIEVE